VDGSRRRRIRRRWVALIGILVVAAVALVVTVCDGAIDVVPSAIGNEGWRIGPPSRLTAQP